LLLRLRIEPVSPYKVIKALSGRRAAWQEAASLASKFLSLKPQGPRVFKAARHLVAWLGARIAIQQ
jgi:hypothetical protein